MAEVERDNRFIAFLERAAVRRERGAFEASADFELFTDDEED
jgi:hypothetical protein